MFQFNHFNFNVLNLEKSLEFYKEALGLDVVREKDASDGSFKIVYLGDGSSDFLLELTWMRDQKEPYNLGDEEFHLALTADDFDKAHALHEKMGCICFEIMIWGFILLMIQMDIGLRSSLRNSILKDILCFRYFYKKKQIQAFGRDSIPRSLLESASFIMMLYFPAIFQILSAVFQKCFISFFHFIDIRFACDLPWCMHA